jgi:hypothetical protein
MRNTTRLAFNSYVSQIAILSSVPSAAEKFTVAPSVAQKLEEKTQVAPADDKVFRSLKRLGCADGIPCDGGCEWRITLAGCQALGLTFPDDDEVRQPMEQAA